MRTLLLLQVLLTAGVQAQTLTPACELVAAHTDSPLPSSYTLTVGPHPFTADHDFALIPACSATVTTSCVASLHIERTTNDPGIVTPQELAACNIPSTATGKRGLRLTVVLAGPLDARSLRAVLGYRDAFGTLRKTTPSNIVVVQLQSGPPTDLRRP